MLMREFVIPISTGLAIFLFGMQVMRIGFEHLFLNKTKQILSVLTNRPFIAFLTGTIVTAILQSSSAVSLITIGLTHARILRLREAIAIILGANIGTCLTTELLAFDIYQIGLPFFIIGACLFLMPNWLLKASGLSIGGFGLLFIGMETMQSILPMLKQAGWIEQMFTYGSAGVVQGVLSGTILTAVIQSSTATTAITMNLMYEQLIPLNMAIALVLGGNIGTCMTAVLGSMGANKTSKQVALAHVILNALGVLLFLPLIPFLATTVQYLTSYPMQQVAHAQTIFNVICSLVVLPYLAYFEKLVLFMSGSR